MRTKTIENVPTPVITITCDRCEGTGNFPRYVRKTECVICGRDVCRNCSYLFEEEYLNTPDAMTDYPSVICKVCWDDGKEFREKIMILKNEAEKQTEALWAEWKEKLKRP